MSKKLTTEEFIQQSQKIHVYKYTYSNTVYTGAANKVIITCPKHGDFEQTPHNHKQGKGCRACANESLAEDRKDSIDKVIQNFKAVHGDSYKYNKIQYKNAQTNVTITCPVHGDFEQAPTSHLAGRGCPECGTERMKSTQEEVLLKFKYAHRDRYKYDKVIYNNMNTNVSIICPEHGEFTQNPDIHMRGHGCPSCSKSGFDKKKPAILYYLKVTTDDNQELYKIGITNKSVNERFSLTDLKKIEIIKQEEFKSGQDALDKETEIKRRFKEFQYKGPNILQNGNTELFTVDLFNL